MAAGGLLLAVGAGASGGPSVRDSGYNTGCDHAYSIGLTKKPPKVTSSHRAKFAWRLNDCFTGDPSDPSNLQYVDFRCKRDAKPFRPCTSPKRYRGLANGRHVFRVKAVFNQGNHEDASDPKRYGWKIRP
jgi:hypothetical protein